jgi:hypothetical protein
MDKDRVTFLLCLPNEGRKSKDMRPDERRMSGVDMLLGDPHVRSYLLLPSSCKSGCGS